MKRRLFDEILGSSATRMPIEVFNFMEENTQRDHRVVYVVLNDQVQKTTWDSDRKLRMAGKIEEVNNGSVVDYFEKFLKRGDFDGIVTNYLLDRDFVEMNYSRIKPSNKEGFHMYVPEKYVPVEVFENEVVQEEIPSESSSSSFFGGLFRRLGF